MGGFWEGLGVELCWVLHRFGERSERAKLSGAGFCSALLGFVADVFFCFLLFVVFLLLFIIFAGLGNAKESVENYG